MRRHFIIAFTAFLTTIFSLNLWAKTTDNQKVDRLVHQFIQAYENCDLKTIAKLYAPEAIAIGTGSDEVLLGKDKIMAGFKRDFSQSAPANISLKKIAMNVQDHVAVASYYVIVNEKHHSKSPQTKLRFTIELVKENNHWLIAQSHLSAPLASQNPGQSFPPHAYS